MWGQFLAGRLWELLLMAGLLLLVLALYRQVGVLERRLGPRSALEIAEEGPPFGERIPHIDGVLGVGEGEL